MDKINANQYQGPPSPKHFQGFQPGPIGAFNPEDEDHIPNAFRPNFPPGLYTQPGPSPGMFQGGGMPVMQQGYAANFSGMQPAYIAVPNGPHEQCREGGNEEPSIVGFQAVKLIRKICRRPPSCAHRRPLYQPPKKCCCSIPSPPLVCSPMPKCRSSNLQSSGCCSKPPPSKCNKSQQPRTPQCQAGRLFLCRAADSRDDQMVVLQELVCDKDAQSGLKEKKTTSVEARFGNSVGVNTESGAEALKYGNVDHVGGLAAGGGVAGAGAGLGVPSNISGGSGGGGGNGLFGLGSITNDGNGNMGMAAALGNMLGLGGIGGMNPMNSMFDPTMMAALAGFGYGGQSGFPGPPGFGQCDHEEDRHKKTPDACDSCDSFERWRLRCECRKKMREECKKKEEGKLGATVSVNTSDPNVAGKSKSSGSVKGKKKDKKGKKGKKKK